MVKRVYGKCDNVEIVFTLNEYTGRWETTVPASEDNTYIFELWAEDEAGNRTYFAAVKVTVDLDLLQFRFSVLEVGAGFAILRCKCCIVFQPDFKRDRSALSKL